LQPQPSAAAFQEPLRHTSLAQESSRVSPPGTHWRVKYSLVPQPHWPAGQQEEKVQLPDAHSLLEAHAAKSDFKFSAFARKTLRPKRITAKTTAAHKTKTDIFLFIFELI
jgi:hypothetical protein